MEIRFLTFLKENPKYFKVSLAILLFLLLNVWTVLATIHNPHKAIFILILTGSIWIVLLWIFLLQKPILTYLLNPLLERSQNFSHKNYFGYSIFGALFIGVFAFVIYEARQSKEQIISLVGLVCMLVISMLLSSNPARIKWRPVFCGILLQVILALLVLKWNTGRTSVHWLTNNVVRFLGYTNNGTNFVFGFVPNPPNICGMDGPFGFTSLPMIIFFGSICSLLYYYGIIQWILIRLAILLQYTMGTTAGESLNSMASVFLGPTEAAILCQSALRTMTESEIFTMMTAGFCMISGSLFAIYIGFGACPVYLISANVMSAPALITVSKLMTPEIQHSKQKDMKTFRFPQCTETSALESISNGAIQTVRIIFAIIANLIVYVAFVTFIDTSIHWLGECVGWDISFDKLMSWAFYPVAYILGVTENHDQTMKLAQLIGLKTVLNEFIAYQKMQDMLLNGELEGRTQMIAIFACCGYSNFSQIGQELGIFIGLCPKRTKSFVSKAVRTLIAGAISCFMTACVAGAIVSDATGCLPTKNIENCLNFYFWIGKYGRVGVWIWNDGTPLTYTHYGSGIPSTSGSTCMLLLTADARESDRDTWSNVYSCSNEYWSACETRPICA